MSNQTITRPATKKNVLRGTLQVVKKDTVKILMIDDHPSQIEGYSCILKSTMQSQDLEISPCYNFCDAYEIITGDAPAHDIVFLDMSMPCYEERQVKSGEDMALLIRSFWPFARIVIITAHSETFLLYNVIKKINPEGVLVKSDFHPADLQKAFVRVMDGETYYSETVREGIRELLSRETYLDTFNRQIIMLLAQGIKTKHLPDHMNISLSAIEKRKALLRDYFCLDKGSDEDIVREARRLGFI